MIQFSCNCVPVAQPRQRSHAFVMQTPQGPVAKAGKPYTPQKHPVNAFKAAVQLAAKQVYQGPPLEGPLLLSLVFRMPRPGYLVWKKKPMPRAWHTTTPDAENVLKAIQDALSGIAWRDDAQVAMVVTRKLYASGDEAPGVEVLIDSLEGVTA